MKTDRGSVVNRLIVAAASRPGINTRVRLLLTTHAMELRFRFPVLPNSGLTSFGESRRFLP
jgi:hypothetical protein